MLRRKVCLSSYEVQEQVSDLEDCLAASTKHPSRCCIQYVSKSGRPSSGHRTGKGQSSSQFPRKVAIKNVLTIGQLHSSPMLVRSCLKFCLLGFNSMRTKNFQMSKLGCEKEEEPEIKLPTYTGSQRKLGSSRETSTSVSSTMPKPLTVWLNKMWKALREMGIPDHLTCLLRNLYGVKKQQLEPCMEKLIHSRSKGVRQGYLLSLCLIYMLSRS